MDNKGAINTSLAEWTSRVPDLQEADLIRCEQSKIQRLANEVLKACVAGDMEQLANYDRLFTSLNFVLDKMIYANKEEIKKYYNIIALSFLSDMLHAYYRVEQKNDIFSKIYGNAIDKKLMEMLHENGSMNLNALAKQMQMKVQNVSNRLNKLKKNNVVIFYKISTNKRETYYSLSVDCIKYLRNVKSVRKKYVQNIGYDQEVDSYKEYLQKEEKKRRIKMPQINELTIEYY